MRVLFSLSLVIVFLLPGATSAKETEQSRNGARAAGSRR